MEATLVVIGGKTNRSEIKLKLPSVFGRGREADITIAHPAVSRQHCRLEEVDGALVLRDNHSTNGVYFGKQRVKEMVIRPGDLFSIGPLTFRAEYDHEGDFPDIGEPRPAEGNEATIQFNTGDELDFSAPPPPDGTPIASTRSKALASKAPADELDLGLDEPQKAKAKLDSGIDFTSDAEPEAAAAIAGDDDDFMSAFQEDDPVAAGLADSAEPAGDDPLADLGFDDAGNGEPDKAEESPRPAKQVVGASAAAADDDLDFDLLGSDTDADADHDEDTTELAVSPLKGQKPAPRKGPAEPEVDDASADADEIEFDSMDDLAPPAKSAAGLDDLDDLDSAGEPAEGRHAGQDKASKPSSAKQPKGKEKHAKDKDAKKGWFSFGKSEKKPARKSDEKKSTSKHAAAELPDLELAASEPEASSAIEDDLPDFMEAESPPPKPAAKPASPHPAAAKAKAAPEKKPERPAKPAASKPAASKPPVDEPDLDFLGSGSASGKPAEDDDGLNDFFQDLGL